MQYVMSLDGGGTKLLCLLADQNGNLVGRSRSGPTNSCFSKPEEVEHSVKTAVTQVLTESGVQRSDIRFVHSAIIAFDKNWLSELIGKQLNCPAEVCSQAEYTLSLYGAIQQEYGALVQSGTGSFAGICTASGCSIAGGKGSIGGDEGSGYYVGHKALVACLRMEDGLGPATLLRERLLDFLKLPDFWPIMSELNQASVNRQRTTIASFCPVVGVCAGEGDAVAVDILQRAGGHLARLLLAVLKKTGIGDEIPVTVSGGAWKTSPLLFRSFSEHIRCELPGIRIIPPVFEPAAGGILLGLRDLGFPVEERLGELKGKLSQFVYPKQLFQYNQNSI